MSNPDDLATLIESTPEMSWLARAACGELQLDELSMFFVEAGRTISDAAESLCGGCAVRRACLDHAYENDIAGGYFGGLSPSRRRALTYEQAVALVEPASAISVAG